MTPEQRRRDRGPERVDPREEPLPAVYPALQRGTRISFWQDELRIDLAQEAALARLEGHDPDAAVAAYRRREVAWRAVTCPLAE